MSAGAAGRETDPSTGDAPPVSPYRLTTLADGVFSIAMTLLVLQLGVPVVTADELAGALGDMWPEFLMYGLSFSVLGVYWLIHHMIYDSIARYDSTLVWLNIIYLMFAALIPFSTALIVEHGALTVTALAYGVNMLALFFLGWAMWTYATTNHRLAVAHIDDDLARGARTMGLIYLVVLAVPLALAFVSPLASMVVYAAVVVAFIGFTVVGRWATVTVWSRGPARPGSSRRERARRRDDLPRNQG